MKIITINREYGAGGHSVGKKVAADLGLEFYDKDIIREVVRATGFDYDMVLDEGEEISKLDSFLAKIGNISSGYYNDSHEKLVEVEKAAVLDLAKKGPCVILGRCADDILLQAGYDCFNVLLYADDIHRAKRVSELIGSTDPSEIKRNILKMDSARHNSYKRFTGKTWGDCKNYHMVLDTGYLGFEKCAEIIEDVVKSL